MTGWARTTLDGLVAEGAGSIKTGPFGTMLKASEYTETGVPVISVGEVAYGELRLRTDTPRVPEAVTERLPEYVLRTGDIVFGRKGGVDRSAWVKPSQDGWFLGSDGIRLRLPESVSSRFIGYQLQTTTTREWLLRHASGSTLLSLNQGTLGRVPILLPPLPVQRAIAEVLGALDDKIAVNDQLQQSSVALGTATYKGGLIAGGSRMLPLHSVAKNVPGKYLAREHYASEGEYFVYGSNSVMGRHDTPLVPGGFAVLAKIGSHCGNLRWSERPAWVNNNASAIVPNESIPPWILRYALERVDMAPHRAGTGQPYIRMESLFAAYVEVPSTAVTPSIAGLLRDLSAAEAFAAEENRTLAATRDALLPQLMSGKLRVRDAEKVVEGVL